VRSDLRRVLFNDSLAEPEKFLAVIYGADHPRIGPLKTLSRLFCQVVKRRFQIRPETVEKSREKVRAAFDRIEADVGPSGYLVGESLNRGGPDGRLDPCAHRHPARVPLHAACSD
jgi:hypothetical protein